MSHRRWWLLIACLGLLGLAFAVHEATRPGRGGPVSGSVVHTADDAGSDAGPDPGAMDEAAAQARKQAIIEASDALHAYFTVLFRSDRSEADAYWVDGRPVPSAEADLRELGPVTGLRIDNARPEPLDGQPVPGAVEIPVRLRIGGEGPLRHYSGHYRLRQTGDGWRISSASIDPSPAQR